MLHLLAAFLAPSHKVALEMLDDLPRSIHMVLCELSGDHTYEFAAHLDQSDKYPVLCGVGGTPPLAAAPYSSPLHLHLLVFGLTPRTGHQI